jgi:hypothetical protein
LNIPTRANIGLEWATRAGKFRLTLLIIVL